MARDFYISGNSMVYVKGAQGSLIASRQELGLSDGPITIQLDNKYLDLTVDTFAEVPVDVQYRLSVVLINITFVHYDEAILDEVLRLNMLADNIGDVGPAWGRLGGGNPLYDPDWRFVSIGISSTVEQKPYTFYSCYAFGPPLILPLGTERSRTQVQFRCIPYTIDPWNGGLGSQNVPLWDNVLLT